MCKPLRRETKRVTLWVPIGIILGVILGSYRDNGKENGSYYLGFRVGNVDPWLINPLPLIGCIIGFLIFRPLKGGGLLIMGLH